MSHSFTCAQISPFTHSLTHNSTGFGHITIAYLASNFVQPQTAHYFQTLLRNDTTDYLANVATWADSVRYSKWAHYTGPFHFIDAKDSPPHSCTVDLARDCKAEGCVVTAIQNYTTQVLDPQLPAWLRAQAAKFVVHFVGDIHQPLHDEDVARGGNGIHVLWEGSELNLHHVWDSSIAERWVGGRVGRGRKPYVRALEWAGELTGKIEGGEFAAEREKWLVGLDFEDMIGTALGWAREGNAYVCSHGKIFLPSCHRLRSGWKASCELQVWAAQTALAGFHRPSVPARDMGMLMLFTLASFATTSLVCGRKRQLFRQKATDRLLRFLLVPGCASGSHFKPININHPHLFGRTARNSASLTKSTSLPRGSGRHRRTGARW